MSLSIGLDIGGTKIAGAVFDASGAEIMQLIQPTPHDYDKLMEATKNLVAKLEEKSGKADFLGAGVPGIHDKVTGRVIVVPNLPYLLEKPVQADLERLLSRKVKIGNDANCAALAEATEGAGRGHRSVFGLIIGTGVGGGFVLNGKIVEGRNGTCGEIGHLPMPSYEESDGERLKCGCGRIGCIEQFICGGALSRQYENQTGQKADAKKISALAQEGDTGALKVLDKYYTLVAKSLMSILHTFDPEVISVSGGLNALPGLYEEVPKRWGNYSIRENPQTKFVPAILGPCAGVRGAALLGRQN